MKVENPSFLTNVAYNKVMKIKFTGFTLPELLIALSILGVIAAFTIPKVLSTTSSKEKIAVAKEAAAMMKGAYAQYQLQATPTSSTGIQDLTPFYNFSEVVTSGLIDEREGLGSENCATAGRVCLKLHNGATLMYFTTVSFAGTGTNNAIWFLVDPDSTYSGSTSGEGKAVKFWLYYQGRVTSQGLINTGTTYSLGVSNPVADAAWFSWD